MRKNDIIRTINLINKKFIVEWMVFMLYTFNFSVNKFSNLISTSIELRGENAIVEDSKLLYYYLCQKYSHSEIEKVIKYIDNILNQMNEKEIHDLLIDFANRN